MKKILLPLFLIITYIANGQVDLNLGLRAYYPFSGNANDVSGNNNNPVFNNATLTADRFGTPNSAYHFNGTSSYIRIPNSSSLNTTNKLSICAWVKPQGFYTGQCHGNSILMKGDGDFLTGNYLLRYDDAAFINYTHCSNPIVDVLHQNFNSGGLWQPAPGYTPYIQSNQWYSVIVTYDGTTAKLYMDCELKVTAPQGSATFTNIYDLFIGKCNTASFPYWVNGDIDEVRIYDRALNQDEVNVLGGCINPLNCNNWLRTQAIGQSVTVGDLDISGNQVTVEANFNCTSFPISRPDKWQDIVSKHANTTDINYVLRMDLAGITTTNGQFLTPPPCDNLITNKTYHVALVYDGSNLKLYRNGIVISQIAATGNLILNNWLTTIGDYAVNNPVGTNFLGYINEVRIWDVARTQSQIQAYMNGSLPSPTTQAGLRGYYTFDNLLNKQGNAAYNGILNNGATINIMNPNCTLTPEAGLAVYAGTDTTFCSNTTVSHVLHGTGTGSYSWSPAIYLNNPNIQNPTATISTTTTFYLTVTGTGVCSGIDSVTIFVEPSPTVKTIEDTLVCSTNPVTLFTSGAQTYSWTPTLFLSNPNIANPVYSGNQSQSYIVTGMAANGCKAKDTVNVTVNVRGALLAPPDKSMCGQSAVQLDGYNGNTVSYLWSPATYLSSTTIINPIANPPATTVYAVKISDAACNYDSTFNVLVLVGAGPTINAGKSNDIDCANPSTILHASGGDFYVWTPSTGLSNPNIPNPVATPTITQKYYVLVITASGCSNIDSVTVSSNRVASLARYMPNAFTPNGDGLNDCYGLKNWMLIRKLEFRIFNRYGEQVFGTSNPNNCWDGTYKGKPALGGSYVFYIKAETTCGTEEQKGNFILIR